MFSALNIYAFTYHCFFTQVCVYFITVVHNVLLTTTCWQQTDFRCDLGEIAREDVG